MGSAVFGWVYLIFDFVLATGEDTSSIPNLLSQRFIDLVDAETDSTSSYQISDAMMTVLQAAAGSLLGRFVALHNGVLPRNLLGEAGLGGDERTR
jgi:hypothetical protein